MFELDEDGYPTEGTINYIENWTWTDDSKITQFKELFDGIKSIWYTSNWGWHERDVIHEIFDGRWMKQYNISTGGWSGNEAIIRAMEKNIWIWSFSWVQARRGGHYIFERPLEEQNATE